MRKQAPGLIDSISVICWNIRGLGGKLEQCDIAEFLFGQNDIVVILETHKDPDFSVQVPGFIYKNFSRYTKHARARRYSGGIGIFYKNKLAPYIEIVSHSEHVVWIRLDMKKEFDNADIISIGCVYMPPENSPYAC